MSKQLPPKANLEHLRKQAKDLLEYLYQGQLSAVEVVGKYFPSQHPVGLSEAQLVLAREYGFESWKALKDHVKPSSKVAQTQFVDLAMEDAAKAKEFWEIHHENLAEDLVCSVMAGDLSSVKKHLAGHQNGNLPPKGRPVLSYLCFSKLANDPEFSPKLEETARFLLEKGADPNAFVEQMWGGEKWRETASYGAAGVLNHPGLTKILLDAGADPDDRSVDGDTYRGESVYHACDHPGKNECLRLLLEAGASQQAKDYCIKRKLDFEDEEGVLVFLKNGANPNKANPRTALSHAVLRGRSPKMIQLLLDNGADPNVPDVDGTRMYGVARKLGYKETAELLAAAGADTTLDPRDEILVAAVDGNEAKVQELAKEHPDVVANLVAPQNLTAGTGFPAALSGQTLHDMARLGNIAAVRALLDLGMDVNIRNHYLETPLHWACVTGHAEVARLLLERGARMDLKDKNHDGTPMGWVGWGSLFWNEIRGDYAKTALTMVEFGAQIPEQPWGNKEIHKALKIN